MFRLFWSKVNVYYRIKKQKIKKNNRNDVVKHIETAAFANCSFISVELSASDPYRVDLGI